MRTDADHPARVRDPANERLLEHTATLADDNASPAVPARWLHSRVLPDRPTMSLANAAQAAYRRWNHSTVRRTASRCGVGSNGPNALWNFEASETNGRSNW